MRNTREHVESLLVAAGARLVRQHKHAIWKLPDGRVITLSNSTSDTLRAERNNLALVARTLGLTPEQLGKSIKNPERRSARASSGRGPGRGLDGGRGELRGLGGIFSGTLSPAAEVPGNPTWREQLRATREVLPPPPPPKLRVPIFDRSKLKTPGVANAQQVVTQKTKLPWPTDR